MTEQLAHANPPRQIETTRSPRGLVPPVDIYENDSELLLVADIPGVENDGLNIQLEPPELRIEGRKVRRDEKHPQSYSRSFHVSESIDPNGISAELSNGVLRVHLKKSSALRHRKIQVKSA